MENFTPLAIGKISLKVNDLERMTNFYEKVIGLDVLSKGDGIASLGISGSDSVLLELVELDSPSQRSKAAGLFHMAFLLPERVDLANVIVHFDEINQRVVNQYDHGLTEAIYLYDPDLNGIEIYRDKHSDELDGQTELRDADKVVPLDSEAIKKIARLDNPTYKMPKGTEFGHVHLAVSSLDKTEYFYKHILGLTVMSELAGQAVFLSDGKYHHQIAGNVWTTKDAPAPKDDERGLQFFELKLSNFNQVIKKLDALSYAYENISDKGIAVDDPNGITIHLLPL